MNLRSKIKYLVSYIYNKDIHIKLPKSTNIHHRGIGLIIGKGVVIGENCDIYHCVTIGEQYGQKKGVPKIGNNVIIFPFVMICGDIKIGDNVIIGSFTKVDCNVPSNCMVVGIPCKIHKGVKYEFTKNDFENFRIIADEDGKVKKIIFDDKLE